MLKAVAIRRQELKISQAELDRIVGCADGYVAKCECGTRTPSMFMFWCFVDALDMDLVVRKRMSKYKAIRTEVDGIVFDSKGESKRWTYLKNCERKNLIKNLKRQVSYPLKIEDELITSYVADFVYMENGTEIVEDFKGHITSVFRLKKKLFEALYDKPLRIVRLVGDDFQLGFKRRRSRKTSK